MRPLSKILAALYVQIDYSPDQLDALAEDPNPLTQQIARDLRNQIEVFRDSERRAGSALAAIERYATDVRNTVESGKMPYSGWINQAALTFDSESESMRLAAQRAAELAAYLRLVEPVTAG